MLLLILTLLWMIIIFLFSSQPADESTQMSGFVKTIVLKALHTMLNGNVPDMFLQNNFDYIIRKLGHATEYLILGILTAASARRIVSGKAIVIALGICILYAASDEFHQIFVSGRGPMVSDVLLDSFSAAFGILLINLKGVIKSYARSVK